MVGPHLFSKFDPRTISVVEVPLYYLQLLLLLLLELATPASSKKAVGGGRILIWNMCRIPSQHVPRNQFYFCTSQTFFAVVFQQPPMPTQFCLGLASLTDFTVLKERKQQLLDRGRVFDKENYCWQMLPHRSKSQQPHTKWR